MIVERRKEKGVMEALWRDAGKGYDRSDRDGYNGTVGRADTAVESRDVDHRYHNKRMGLYATCYRGI